MSQPEESITGRSLNATTALFHASGPQDELDQQATLALEEALASLFDPILPLGNDHLVYLMRQTYWRGRRDGLQEALDIQFGPHA